MTTAAAEKMKNPGGGDGLPRDQDDGRLRRWTDGDRAPRGDGMDAADEKTGDSGR